jgi:phage terminase large subunit-like protein
MLMTAKGNAVQKRGPVRKDANSQRPTTLGPVYALFIETFLVFSEGDRRGEQAQLFPVQREWLNEMFKLDSIGNFQFETGMLGIARGAGKTQFMAWVAAASLFADVFSHIVDPDVTIGAASFDNAKLLFQATATALSEGPLANLVECFDTEIIRKQDKRGVIRRLAAQGTTVSVR